MASDIEANDEEELNGFYMSKHDEVDFNN